MAWREVEPELELYHLTREHRICRKYCSESVGKSGGEWRIVVMSRGNIGVYIRASGIAMSAAHSSRKYRRNNYSPPCFSYGSTTVFAANSMPRKMVTFQLLFNLPQGVQNWSEIFEADLPSP